MSMPQSQLQKYWGHDGMHAGVRATQEARAESNNALTRAKQGMARFITKGDDLDHTRPVRFLRFNLSLFD